MKQILINTIGVCIIIAFYVVAIFFGEETGLRTTTIVVVSLIFITLIINAIRKK